MCCRLAQLAERLTLDQKVLGSSPRSAAICLYSLRHMNPSGCSASLLPRSPCRVTRDSTYSSSTHLGFTLIELLVVIAIIAIMGAILFPVFTKAKQKAQLTKCMNNMAQLSKAITMYSDSNNGATPFAWNLIDKNWSVWYRDTWRERIQPFLKNRAALRCPVKTKAQVYKPPDYPETGHYGINVYITMDDSATTYIGWRLFSSIPRPAKTILVSENKDGDWSAEPLDNYATGSAGQFYPYHDDGTAKGGIFIFCDGHASFMSIYTTQSTVNNIPFYYWRIRK